MDHGQSSRLIFSLLLLVTLSSLSCRQIASKSEVSDTSIPVFANYYLTLSGNEIIDGIDTISIKSEIRDNDSLFRVMSNGLLVNTVRGKDVEYFVEHENRRYRIYDSTRVDFSYSVPTYLYRYSDTVVYNRMLNFSGVETYNSELFGPIPIEKYTSQEVKSEDDEIVIFPARIDFFSRAHGVIAIHFLDSSNRVITRQELIDLYKID